ncbi:pollen receptor-like kinase 3 [Magnolia sinica]|uniref:pollen receptor-like kinase 3 n=1 Tax=Magnolia sinica TaxID=86752 RepID=UPI00265A5DF6|nr:pollen receptor-like kinase 3 [Magnolia sinica]
MAAVPHLRPFLFLFILSLPSLSSPLSESDALLALKKSFDNTTALDSWSPDSPPPCTTDQGSKKKSSWVGVICFNGVVAGLRLGSMGLSGKIDVDALASLPGLRTIGFIGNKFAGPIPELNRLGALKAIYLTENRFSGEIPPDFFSSMSSLKKVWLGGNEFTGPIPNSISKLKLLIELHLENNHFSGNIPPISLPMLASFDVSNNALQGNIPEGLLMFDGNSFKANVGLCGPPVGKQCSDMMVASTVTVPDSGASKPSYAAVATGLFLLIALMGMAIVALARRQDDDFEMLGRDIGGDGAVSVSVRESSVRSKESVRRESHHGRKGMGPAVPDLTMVNEDKGQFGLPDLMKAAAEVLGTGGLGSAYKAVMANGVAVVVKRMREMNRVGSDRFEVEMRRLGSLRHQNILPPLAFHYRKEEKLLVYEFVPKGSLLYLLHGDRGPCHAELDWPTRLKIVRGIARGMAFLHVELSNSDIPHGNLKSCNIFLGPDFEPLLADYGFFPLVAPTEATNAMFAYKSPESLQYRHVSPKSDVYCLGVVILEILTGKFPSQYLNHGKGGTDVVQWVVTAISEKREWELFDPEISGPGKADPTMERLLHVGAECAQPNPEQRPDMKEAVRRIEEIAVEASCNKERSVGPAPSLKDGYADIPVPQSNAANVQQPSSRSTTENIGHPPSLQRNGESFVFDIS